MTISFKVTLKLTFFWMFSTLAVSVANAHLMVAQHGTLNIVDDSAFMVLSLPVSAFEGVDDDNSGEVSMIEFNNHRDLIIDNILGGVTLSDPQTELAMQGLMLSPVLPHEVQGSSITQFVVMARFPLADPAATLRFYVGIYGRETAEQSLEITASRASDRLKTVFDLTPTAPALSVF